MGFPRAKAQEQFVSWPIDIKDYLSQDEQWQKMLERTTF